MARLRVPKFPATLSVVAAERGYGIIESADGVLNDYVAQYALQSVALHRIVQTKTAQPAKAKRGRKAREKAAAAEQAVQ